MGKLREMGQSCAFRDDLDIELLVLDFGCGQSANLEHLGDC
jgi:hypothetical protein